MKNFVVFSLLCLLFVTTVHSVGSVFAYSNEEMEFYFNNKIFTYSLEENIKTSTQFDLNYEINKYNRFGLKNERKKLLTHMLSIGIDKEIALDYILPNIRKTINKIEKNIYTPPKDAILTINSNNEKVFNITSETIGISLNRSKLVDTICNQFLNDLPLKLDIPTIKSTPQVTKNNLVNHTYLRADFSTDISSSSLDRKHNIKNALTTLNKIEIAPNEIFSFNKIVGRRTAENGYRQAKIIVNNEFVDGIGGGVCQVSSTLYNAVLMAGLDIVEANKHSKQVSYVKAGFDAMVNYGSSDLKFKNNTNQKITIITNYTNSKARIRIFGENLNNIFYKLSNEVFNIVEPVEEITFDFKGEYLDKIKYNDEYFYSKLGNRGLEIKTYREKYINNRLAEKTLIRHDKYKVQNSIKMFGTLNRENNQGNKASVKPFALLDTKSAETICA